MHIGRPVTSGSAFQHRTCVSAQERGGSSGGGGGGGGGGRKGKGKMRAAAGDGVSPPDEEAARQLEEQEQFEGACQESSITTRRHESYRAVGPTDSSTAAPALPVQEVVAADGGAAGTACATRRRCRAPRAAAIAGEASRVGGGIQYEY
jgi:hypothetical protein